SVCDNNSCALVGDSDFGRWIAVGAAHNRSGFKWFDDPPALSVINVVIGVACDFKANSVAFFIDNEPLMVNHKPLVLTPPNVGECVPFVAVTNMLEVAFVHDWIPPPPLSPPSPVNDNS